jgi:predicted nicotinamide N-methyase
MAHALDAAAHAEKAFEETSRREVPSTSASPRKETRSLPFIRVRGLRVLELGAGCGLCGLAAAAVGAGEVVLTEGAPGALAALQRSAASNVSGVAATVAFLDWRDDQETLDATARGKHPDVREARAVSVSESQRAFPRTTSDSEARGPAREPEAETRATNPEGTNWVHKIAGGSDAARALPRLPTDETFDIVLGSDLLYDSTHAAPLAASIASRVRKTEIARAHVALAVRSGALVADLAANAARRGMLVEVRALDEFEEEKGVLRTHQGGHITRQETEGTERWRVSGGEAFSRGDGFSVVSMFGRFGNEHRAGDQSDGTEGPTPSSETAVDANAFEAFEAAIAKLEGRIAMVTFRWPRDAWRAEWEE